MSVALVLAVGHDPLILATRTSVLRSAGYLVEPVHSASEALDRFREGDFDLVVLCHSVPPMERDRLCRSISASGACTPVLTVSPFADPCDSSDSVVDSHPQKLLQAIEIALQRAAALYDLKEADTSDAADAGERPTVLCIDDEPNALQTRRWILERAGYAVLTSLSGLEGLQLFSNRSVDAVVLDYAMPDMDGGVAAAEMRQRRKDVPLILYSGYPNVPDEVRAMFDCFIPKGTSPHVLIATLAKFIPDAGKQKPPTKSSVATMRRAKYGTNQ